MMHRLLACASIAALVLGASLPAHAEAPAREMLAAAPKGDAAMVAAIGGMALGLGWANAELITRKQPPLYCLPPDLVLTAFQTVSVLENFLKREPYYADIPTGAAVLHAMIATYPCGR